MGWVHCCILISIEEFFSYLTATTFKSTKKGNAISIAYLSFSVIRADLNNKYKIELKSSQLDLNLMSIHENIKELNSLFKLFIMYVS